MGSIPPGRTMINWYINLFNGFSVWTLILLSAITTILGDYFGKLWSTNLRPEFFWLNVLFYTLSSLLFLPALLKESLTITSVAWSLLSIIGFMFIGLIIFKETLTLIQIIALIFGVISLVLFSL
ncbi:MAG: hypothetical protein WC069_01440 [Candidatus Shapirobacteria bacterium]